MHMRPFRLLYRRRLSGMTLLEILVAVVILTIGLCGVLALFPVAIDSVGTMTKRTNGTALASNAINSIQMGVVKLYCNNYAYHLGRPRDATTDVCIAAGSVYYNAFSDWPDGIDQAGSSFHAANRYFQIPGDLVTDADFDDSATAGTKQMVTPSENWNLPDGYGWTAAFVPFPGDPNGTANTRYNVQIAVWRKYDARMIGRIVSSTARTVTFSAACPPWIGPGDYISYGPKGVWSKIQTISDDRLTVTTWQDHEIPNSTVPVNAASHMWLTGLYNTTVYPQALR